MLTRKTPLARKTPLVARKRLVAKKALKRSPMPKKAKPKSHRRGPERSPAFLEFVRAQPCLIEGCREPSEAHHFGRRGVGQKCSDFLCVPLCHYHHVEVWHRKGSLPGATHDECILLFHAVAERLVLEFHGTV